MDLSLKGKTQRQLIAAVIFISTVAVAVSVLAVLFVLNFDRIKVYIHDPARPPVSQGPTPSTPPTKAPSASNSPPLAHHMRDRRAAPHRTRHHATNHHTQPPANTQGPGKGHVHKHKHKHKHKVSSHKNVQGPSALVPSKSANPGKGHYHASNKKLHRHHKHHPHKH